MMNSSRLLKEDLPKGNSRLVWNLLLGTSLLITGLAAGTYRHHQDPAQWIPNRYGWLGCVSCPGGMGSFADEKQDCLMNLFLNLITFSK